MKLHHLDPRTVFNIKAPMWRGNPEDRKVGLALHRIQKHNVINFTYRRKSDGKLSIPDQYYFDGDKLNEIDYERQNIKGVTLVYVPFSDLELIDNLPDDW